MMDRGDGVVGDNFRGSSLEWVDTVLSMLYFFSFMGVTTCIVSEMVERSRSFGEDCCMFRRDASMIA